MLAAFTLWGHALAALLFAVIAAAQARRAVTAMPRLAFTCALGLTALWALAVAGIDTRDSVARLVESLRDLAWLAFMVALVRRGREPAVGVTLVYAVVAAIIVAATTLDIALGSTGAAFDPSLLAAARVLRMIVAVSALVLVQHLYTTVAPGERNGLRLVVIALALFWACDLVLYAAAYFSGTWPTGIVALRGVVLASLAPVFALAVHRNGDWSLQISRTVAYQSLSLVGIALYVLAMVVATGVIATIGGSHARVIETAFVFGTTAAILTIISTPWLRAWTRVKLAKHLFRHRYDYRAEWVRFTDTLGQPGADAAPLEQRIVKAVADVMDAPGGLLMVPDAGGLGVTGAWNWDRGDLPGSGDGTALAARLGDGRIVELDAVRAPNGDALIRADVPLWMLDRADAWALVPLTHFDRLAGIILLDRPPVDRQLDWEDFDLLRILGRQAASYLAEAASHAALADARRFDEFNRRFAFILHDIKNLVSQITLVARNAERHADNPDFRADMVATLAETASRMNALLARLSQHHVGRPDRIGPVALDQLVARLAATRRAQHPITVVGSASRPALADPARLEQVLGHLVQNAVEASPADVAVTLALGEEGARAVIDVVDHGCGMSPAFVHDQLFRPFVSSKPGGFGIGAFEARQLTEAMGGSLTVASREGEGTRFRVALPFAGEDHRDMEKAA